MATSSLYKGAGLGLPETKPVLDGKMLLDTYGERIFRFTYRMLGNRAKAEDATAETLFRAVRRGKELRADAALQTWLFRIARNVCIDEIRRRKTEELPDTAATRSPEDRLALEATVAQAIQDLQQEYREAVLLYHFQGLPAAEGAETLGISVPAFKSRLYRGRKVLRDKFLSLGYTPAKRSRKPRQDDNPVYVYTGEPITA